ncbi:hydantoinase B/oxoprolinase family protein [Microvirga antarctica]|uniref:hydantoinase B/oxoprolinase family protein n=1 Tax=Microvirga antarctica TaxID=2819233 RepID=UPI001B306418|nr:hydantoinase B/oxoprolinase family protein [Microvirga antarctica]
MARLAQNLDAIDLEIRWTRLVTIMDEVDAAVARTSFSTIVGESRDFGVVMLDSQGRSLAQSQLSTPAFTVTLPMTAKHLLRACPVETLRPGDVLITNDPWLGSGHLPDMTIITPVFHRGKVAGFIGCVAHISDIGGRSDYLDDKELFEEGLRIPPTFLMRDGEPVEVLFDILAANVRVPRLVIGDIRALVGAEALGARRLLEFLADYDMDVLDSLADVILARSETAMDEAIRSLPDGVYHAEMDADGHRHPIHIAVTATIADGRVTVDFEGSSDEQHDSSINCVMNTTFSDTYYPFKCSLLPGVPNNEGLSRFLTVKAPKGSIFNVNFPRAVRARSKSSFHIHAVLYEALAPILGQRVQAASGSFWTLVASGTGTDGELYRAHMLPNGGKGAVTAMDGLATIAFPYNGMITPVEIFENAAPVLIGCRELIADSGGAGQYRGGLGQRITFEPIGPNPLTVFVRPDKLRHPPAGLLGGLPGRAGEILVNGKPTPPEPTTLQSGDVLELRLPGGGGFGQPSARAGERLKADLESGYVSSEASRQLYQLQVE